MTLTLFHHFLAFHPSFQKDYQEKKGKPYKKEKRTKWNDYNNYATSWEQNHVWKKHFKISEHSIVAQNHKRILTISQSMFFMINSVRRIVNAEKVGYFFFVSWSHTFTLHTCCIASV